MLWRHHNNTLTWVDNAVYLRDLCFCGCFQELSGFKNKNVYPNKVWDKSKTTWGVGIAQFTHHSVRGGGKNPSTCGLRIFAPTLNLVLS